MDGVQCLLAGGLSLRGKVGSPSGRLNYIRYFFRNFESIEMKQNLILLHGALGSSQSFDALLPYLSDDFNVFVPDIKWHGDRSEAGSVFKMQDLADDLEDIFENEQVQFTNVFGFSMGGYIALTLALKKPQYFRKVMTLGTKLDWKVEQAEKETKMLNPDKIQEKVPQFAQHLQSLHGENWSNLCRQTAGMMLDLGQQPILTSDNISTLEFPIRIGLGDKDNMVSFDETVAFYKALSQGEMQVFPNCLHPIEKVNAETLARAIMDFAK